MSVVYRLLIVSLFYLIASAAIISEHKNRGLIVQLIELLKSPTNQSVIENTNHTVKADQEKRIDFENPNEFEGPFAPVNTSSELSKFLYNSHRSILKAVRQCDCAPAAAPAVVGIGVLGILAAGIAAAVAAVGPAVAISTAVGIGVGAGLATVEIVEPLGPIVIARFPCQETPENNLDIPTSGPFYSNFGCNNNSVRFDTQQIKTRRQRNFRNSKAQDASGTCVPLLRRGPCASPFEWVTVDPITLKGRCSPRICGREMVLVECDGLCHDIEDPNECRGGRRLYYTIFGNTTCDCPIGQFPFPNRDSGCVALFTQGPCPPGLVMTFSRQDKLVCSPTQCPPANNPETGKPFQMVPFGDGQCYPLGTQGPCPPNHLLGYDVFEHRVECVNMKDPSSSYFSSPEEDALIDSLYIQIHPDYNFQVALAYQNLLSRNDTAERKQGGVFQLPNSTPSSLMGGCRPGGSGCASPSVPSSGSRQARQATGSPSCGGGQRYSEATGQCRDQF